MPLTLKAKPGVHWDVHPAIEAAQPTIAEVYAEHGAEAVVTSAKDGAHSARSAHHSRPGDPRPASAIDLRTRSLQPATVPLLAGTLVGRLNGAGPGRWYAVIEPDHLHLEYSEARPNIKGWTAGRFVYRKGDA